MSDDTTKELEENEFQNKVEGEQAINALYDALDKDGLLTGQSVENVVNLVNRVKQLETEVEVLKDLVSRSLNVKKDEVLKG